MIVKYILFLIGIFFLYYGADWFVRGSSRIASILKVTPLVIGLTVVAFGTSAPELVVSLIASMRNEPAITLGNVIGSNIANIGLVLGISALVRPLECNVKTIRREIPIMILSALILLVVAMDSEISFWNGVILFFGIIIFILVNYRSMIREKNELPEEIVREYRDHIQSKDKSIPIAMAITLAGLGFLLFGAHLIIESAVHIAEALGVSRKIIALSMVAIGTSLPELATSVVAIRKGEHDISLGNIIGSCIFNIFCVIGVIAIVSPIRVSADFTWDYLVMLGLSLILFPIIGSKSYISRFEGGLLLFLYLIYIGWLASTI